MKNHFPIFRTLATLALIMCLHTISIAQPPPPPSGHAGAGNAPPGPSGGAPIGDGMFFLIGLAGLYAGKKIYDLRSTPANE